MAGMEFSQELITSDHFVACMATSSREDEVYPSVHGTSNHKLESYMMFVLAKLLLTGRQTRWTLSEDIRTFNHHPSDRKVSKARCTNRRHIGCHCSSHLLQLIC